MDLKTYDSPLWQADIDEIRAELERFEEIYARRPFDNFQGLQGPGAFTLFYYLRKIKPVVVIESGVWRGFSTWIIEQSVPEARLFCCDPIFGYVQMMKPEISEGRYVSKHAHRTHQDFSCAQFDIAGIDREKILAFFDDHQNKVPRLNQSRAKGIGHVIFDDNQPWHHTHVSLEELRSEPEFHALMPRLIDRYETMPPLWDVSFPGQTPAHVPRLAVGDAELFPQVQAHRACYGFMTYVHLRP